MPRLNEKAGTRLFKVKARDALSDLVKAMGRYKRHETRELAKFQANKVAHPAVVINTVANNAQADFDTILTRLTVALSLTIQGVLPAPA